MIEGLLSQLEMVRRSGKGYLARCPAHGDGRPSLQITEGDDGRILMHCFAGCAPGDVAAALGLSLADLFPDGTQSQRAAVAAKLANMPLGGASYRSANLQSDSVSQADAAKMLSDYGQRLWQDCAHLPGTIGEQYLIARGCVVPPAFGHLRFHAALNHPTGYVGPALVALITDPMTGEPISLHRTWIRPDGSKADVDPPRAVLKGHTSKGVVRLWPDEFVSYGLAVGEGIESCLSLAHGITPVWSCINANGLASLPVLPGVECLLIGADHDDAGIKAANACATRWTLADRDVRLAIPPKPKQDLNDLVREVA